MNWYVLHTRPRGEKKVDENLLSLRINTYYPNRPIFKQFSENFTNYLNV